MSWFRWFRRRKAPSHPIPPAVQEPSFHREASSHSSAAETAFTVVENRAFLADVPYALPKDHEEIHRLDLQYYLLRAARRGNYAVPLTQPRHILDVGCGTGRWGQDIARQFPQARVIGLDVVDHSSEQVGYQLPANYRFLQGDILQGLPFPEETFDFVHQRLLYFALPASAWPTVARELVRVTRRQGWLELLEGEVVFRQGGPACQQVAQWALDMARLRQIDLTQGASIARFLQQAGCRAVQAQEIAIPIGEWGGRLGRMAATDLLAGARALKPVVLSRFQTTEQDFEHVLEEMRQEWQTRQCSLIFYSAWGQRP